MFHIFLSLRSPLPADRAAYHCCIVYTRTAVLQLATCSTVCRHPALIICIPRLQTVLVRPMTCLPFSPDNRPSNTRPLALWESAEQMSTCCAADRHGAVSAHLQQQLHALAAGTSAPIGLLAESKAFIRVSCYKRGNSHSHICTTGRTLMNAHSQQPAQQATQRHPPTSTDIHCHHAHILARATVACMRVHTC